jgi:G3E family GTPase
MTPVTAHLITGFPGAGKSTLLRVLLAQRPHGEHWALLLNGNSRIDSAYGITVHQLGDACACCTGRVRFRTALVQLLRSARAQRLWIELAGTGDPAGVKLVLNEASISAAATLANTICVVQPRHLANADIAAHGIYAAQLNHADQFVLAQADAATRAALAPRGKPVIEMHGATLNALTSAAGAYSNDSSRRISS